MRRLLAILSTTIVISLGLITLLGLFLTGSLMGSWASIFIQLAVIVGAVAVVIGVLNLLRVHLQRALNGEAGWGYSVVLVLGALAVIVVALVERLGLLEGAVEPGVSLSSFLFNAVQVPVESALAGLLVFFLVYAAARLMRRRVTWWGLLFTITLLVVLLGWLRIPALGVFNDVSEWIRNVWASAGTRGLLIGIALGTVTAGFRVLLGQDPSYRE